MAEHPNVLFCNDRGHQFVTDIERNTPTMNKQAGGRPAKSGARRELKTFRLIPEALNNLEALARERNATVSDVLNDVLLRRGDTVVTPDGARARRFDVVGGEGTALGKVRPFRVLAGSGRGDGHALNQQLERLRDSLAGVLLELENIMAEQQGQAGVSSLREIETEYESGFRAGMLEGLETAHYLLQAELLIAT